MIAEKENRSLMLELSSHSGTTYDSTRERVVGL